jgi:threonine synthase
MTIATAIVDPLTGYEADGTYTLKTIHSSGGLAVTISDSEILDAVDKLARLEGIFTEPSGAASIAGTKKLIIQGSIKSGDTVVCLATGSGFKETAKYSRLFDLPSPIKPTGCGLDCALERIMHRL